MSYVCWLGNAFLFKIIPNVFTSNRKIGEIE